MLNSNIEQFNLPPVNRKELLRYASIKGALDETTATLLEECLAEATDLLFGKVCYQVLPTKDLLQLLPSAQQSSDFTRYLRGCDYVVAFVATVGITIDRLIARYATVSTSKAFIFQALGAERIECLCDLFSQKTADFVAEKGMSVKPRFSPGYGDFSLNVQRELFALLTPETSVGVTLTTNMMMSPTKSVSALIGIGKDVKGGASCETCTQKQCIYQRNEYEH